MLNLRPFQIILLATFGVLGFFAVAYLSNYTSPAPAGQTEYGEVVAWGTMDSAAFSTTFQKVTKDQENFQDVKYYQLSGRDFDNTLVNAIAEGRSPDIVVLPSTKLVTHRTKLLSLPYTAGTYRNTNVDGADIFVVGNMQYATPFAVDPIVMYWNRDMFASNGIAQPPATWEQVVAMAVPNLTVRDASNNILQSGLAFGSYDNVTHAKEILMLLALQSGSAMVTTGEQEFNVALNTSVVAGASLPLSSALQFYTDFGNASNPLYSWNRSMEQDKNAFISGDLGLYFGFASEAENIDSKNPNLNFDVTSVPQGGASTARRTYGEFYGFSVLKAAPNVKGAAAVITTLTSAQYADDLTRGLNMSPVRRDLIAVGDSSPYRTVMMQSALVARSWLDPDPVASSAIFRQMVEEVVAGRSRTNAAVNDAIKRLELEY